MALNMSEEVTKIKYDMGIYGIHLPLENPDAVIEDVIKRFTLPTFSVYQPYYDHLHLSLNELKEDKQYDNPERNGIGYLLPEFPNRKLLYVSDVQYSSSAGGGMGGYNTYDFGAIMPYTNVTLLQQAMLANSASMVQGLLNPKLTFDFIEPCHLIIYDAVMTNTVDIELAFVHHESLATIPRTCEPSFYKLALYDVENAFYNIAKHWKNIETVYGNINLDIDNWADASQARQTLLEDWDNNYHMDIPKGIIYK